MNAILLKQRLATIQDHLKDGLVERDEAVRLALLASIAGEHLLLLGPPGTGKSMLARRLRGAFKEAAYFERLLTRFSVPEELFGPLSLRALEEDRYQRKTHGYLPEAAIAFLDEIFKANSAILNALLTLLNERAFDNDGQRHPTPLISVIGASNELPEGDELDALYDRFLLRLFVGPVSDAGVDALMDLPSGPSGTVPLALQLTTDSLQSLQADARSVSLTDDLRDLLKDLRGFLRTEGIGFSDRRLRKVVELLQVAAHTDGRTTATVWDAWLVQHCAWEDPSQRPLVRDWWAARVGTLRATSPTRLLEMVSAWEDRLSTLGTELSQQVNAEGAPLFHTPDGSLTPVDTLDVAQHTANGDPLYLAPPLDSYQTPRAVRTKPDGSGYTLAELDDIDLWDEDDGGQFFRSWKGVSTYLDDPINRLTARTQLDPAMAPTAHPADHIQGWVSQLDEVLTTVEGYLDGLAHRVNGLDEVRSHLWLPPTVADNASKTLAESQTKALELRTRLHSLRDGFEGLPVGA